MEIRMKTVSYFRPWKLCYREFTFIESIEVCAIKDPMPSDGPCVFKVESSYFYGKDDYFDEDTSWWKINL
jgi:hypothetical protein